jgi:hypothetical protein
MTHLRQAKNQSRKPSLGFTLAEVMVVMGIALLLGLVLVGIFSQSRAALDKSSSNLDLTGRARIPIERASFYISSAVTTNGFKGVVFPQIADVDAATSADLSTWPRHVILSTTEDFSNPAYNPERDLTEQGVGHYILNSPPVFHYLIWFEGNVGGGGHDILPDVDNTLCMSKLIYPGTAGDTQSWREDPFSTLDPDPDVKLRVLGQNIQDVAFRRVLNNGLAMHVTTLGTVRNASGATEDASYSQTAVIQVPTFTLP